MAARQIPSRVRLLYAGLPVIITLACGPAEQAGTGMMALPVGVATVERRDVPLSVEMVGATLGAQDVPIRARVEGFLETLDFVEGRFVKQGDLLYTIDAQPFQARLVEAQSALAAAQTNLVRAQSDLARIRPLAEIDAVSQQDLDSAVAQEAAAHANVRASGAGVELALIELSYTRIKAPIDGLIGLSKARPGEFVGRDPNPVVLNTLSDIDPIRVRFSISEREYLVLARNYLEVQGQNREDATGDRPHDLILLLADGSQHPHHGSVIATAQSVDPETGTYKVDASFPNPNNILLPGQFARVRAPYRTLQDVTVVPRRALVEMQGLYRLYVVGADNIVSVVDVMPGPTTGNITVIEKGLNGGETIVVEGLQKVRPGMTVTPRPLAEPAAAASQETEL